MRPLLILSAVVLSVFFLFGVRGWLHRRATGSWGVCGLSGEAGSKGWWGGVLFGFAALTFVGAPILVATRVDRLAWTPCIASDLAGASLTALGIIGCFWAQSAMGHAWRIGVGRDDRTELVRRGPFRWV